MLFRRIFQQSLSVKLQKCFQLVEVLLIPVLLYISSVPVCINSTQIQSPGHRPCNSPEHCSSGQKLVSVNLKICVWSIHINISQIPSHAHPVLGPLCPRLKKVHVEPLCYQCTHPPFLSSLMVNSMEIYREETYSYSSSN